MTTTPADIGTIYLIADPTKMPGYTTVVQAGEYELAITVPNCQMSATLQRWHGGQWHDLNGILPDCTRATGANGIRTQPHQALRLPACGVRISADMDLLGITATLTKVGEFIPIKETLW